MPPLASYKTRASEFQPDKNLVICEVGTEVINSVDVSFQQF
jgi:hypothetical protein